MAVAMRILPIILLLSALSSVIADPVIVGHPGVPPLDRPTLERIYTGRVVEIGGVRVTPVNLPSGSPIRDDFLRGYLDQDEDKYTGYWTVRRYIGKGAPPRELATPAEVIDFVSKTAGAIGYVDRAEVGQGVRILLPSGR